MDSKIFGSLNTYFDLYASLSRCPLSKGTLAKELKDRGKSQSTASEQAGSALKGSFPFITGEGDMATLDREALSEFLMQACQEFNLDAQIKPKSKSKKEEDGSEYFTEPITSAKSQNFKNMNKEVNDAKAANKKLQDLVQKQAEQIVKLQEEQLKKVSVAIVENMDQKVIVPASVTSSPPEVLAKDFFLDNPVMELDPEVLVSKNGGLLDSLYGSLGEEVPEITEENYWKRICKRFLSGKLFEKRLADQEGLLEEATKGQANEKPKESLDKNRIRSINMLLSDESMDNQTKLSTYAFWYFHDDPEMEELLVFAGEHGINANYVIGLLEKPQELRNYRTMRGFLKQVQMSSEAHIKREAAKELLCGEWRVVAEYCGKPCEFRMVPVDELEEFRKCLKENKVSKALTSVKKLLESTFGPMDQKLEEGVWEEAEDIPAPDFIHPNSEEVDEHAQPEGDVGMSDFEEMEVKDEQ